jgi:hypothetical protein
MTARGGASAQGHHGEAAAFGPRAADAGGAQHAGVDGPADRALANLEPLGRLGDRQ